MKLTNNEFDVLESLLAIRAMRSHDADLERRLRERHHVAMRRFGSGGHGKGGRARAIICDGLGAFPSVTALASRLEITPSAVSAAIKRGSLVMGQYRISMAAAQG